MDGEDLPRALARKYEQAETDGERMHVGQKLHALIITAAGKCVCFIGCLYK
jgi:hypothetical protein